ncbi:MAG: magnesium transporter, partial [Bacillota bacterium]
PFLLRKLGFDPATSSAPLVTSVLDIIGILTYFIIATRVLNL